VRVYQFRHLGLKGVKKKPFIKISKNYCVLAVFVVAVFEAGEAAVLALPTFAFEAVILALVTAIFASVAAFVWVFDPIAFSVATAELAFESAPPVVAGDSAGIPPDSNTERPPVNACWLSRNAESIKTVAATMVIFDKILSVPRGPKAVLETLLVKSAPASDLPGCNSTDAINVRHERMNNA
jgi:hypothetical protein